MSTVDSTAVAIREPEHSAPSVMSQYEITQTFEVAKALAASGMFKDVRQAEQAFAKILIGRDLGLSATEALMGIDMIEGKPELSANLQASFVARSRDHDYRVVELTDAACEIAFFRHGAEVGRSRFTMGDAQQAGLAGRGPWKSYPRNMLYARAMTNGIAWFCPEVTGGVRVFSEGEISGEAQETQAAESIEAAPPVELHDRPELVEQVKEAVRSERVAKQDLMAKIAELGAVRGATVSETLASLTDEGAEGLVGWLSDLPEPEPASDVPEVTTEQLYSLHDDAVGAGAISTAEVIGSAEAVGGAKNASSLRQAIESLNAGGRAALWDVLREAMDLKAAEGAAA